MFEFASSAHKLADAGAKCRHCGLPISWVYPVVEAVTGLLFLAVYWRFGFSAATPVYMLLCAGMVVVTFQDLADWTIPDEITLPGIPAGVGLALLGMVWGPESGLRVTQVFDALLGVLVGGGILFTLDRVTVLLLKKPGMGMGDVKLLAMLGAFLGWRGALGTLMAASIIGSVVGLGLILYMRARPTAAKAAPADGRGGCGGHGAEGG
jgi:leader peptidase (prepilin peptidase) / N-methyltransferase